MRKNPKLSGTTHNVFGIQVGVSINLFVKKQNGFPKSHTKIYYAATDQYWRKGQKYKFLDDRLCYKSLEWKEVISDRRHNWLTAGMHEEFETFLPIGSKFEKLSNMLSPRSIFKTFSLGVSTNRDATVYGDSKTELIKAVERFCDYYNAEIRRYMQKDKPKDVDNFLTYDEIKWSRNLKRHMMNCNIVNIDEKNIRFSLYRPFTRKYIYFWDIAVDELGDNQSFFPTISCEVENRVICLTDRGSEKPFMTIMSNVITDLHVVGAGSGTQCFPFYTYEEDGINRQENITDWVLEQFRTHYSDTNISKWDIFHYVYAVLHHPQYREKYAANLKRELPRIPFTPDFWGFVEAGKNSHISTCTTKTRKSTYST